MEKLKLNSQWQQRKEQLNENWLYDKEQWKQKWNSGKLPASGDATEYKKVNHKIKGNGLTKVRQFDNKSNKKIDDWFKKNPNKNQTPWL
jgi:hypothetical protein